MKGGKLGGSRCGKWNRRSEGCVVQKLCRIITCSSCVFDHVGKSPHVIHSFAGFWYPADNLYFISLYHWYKY